jgi:hypothetical protein
MYPGTICWVPFKMKFDLSFACRSRESKHLQQLEEQQRFAQQLQQIADASAAPSTAALGAATSPSTAAADADALAAIVEGLGPGADAAAKLAAAAAANPALLIANTWALDGITEERETGFTGVGASKDLGLGGLQGAVDTQHGLGDASASASSAANAEAAVSEAEKAEAEAEAAAAVQQYYRQLHEAARQQAALNAQVKGTYGLKAYKGEVGVLLYSQTSSGAHSAC